MAEMITVGHVGSMISEYIETGVPFLRSQNVTPFRFDPVDLKYISPAFHQKLRKSALKPKDVVVVRTGNPGASCVIPVSLKHANCSDLVIVRCGKQLDPHFVSYYINSVTHSHVRNQSVGAIQKHFNVGSAKELPLPEISRVDQKKIGRALAGLDARIALNDEINAELEAMAKLLYDYWFVQFDFPMTHAQAKSLRRPSLQGKPYKSSGGKLTHNRVLNRLIPEGWDADNILKISNLGGGGTPTKERAEYWTGHIPFFTPTDALPAPFLLDTEAHITDVALENSSTALFPAGSLFLTARGSVGKVMITAREMAMSQSCYALIPHEGISSQFLYFQALGIMDYLKVKSSGSIFKSIVTNDIKYSPTIIPPKETIADFSGVTEAMFEKIKNNLRQNQELAQLRDWLLPMLMNGQVTVRA